jgi:uncharacterized protein (TIGR03084 family)
VDELIAALSDQLDELRSVVGVLGDDDLARPSTCDGWSLSDVLLHLAQTNELAVASLEGRFGAGAGSFARRGGTNVDEAAELSVGLERGATGTEVLARWSASADAMSAAFQATDPHARVMWVAGRLSARTLTTTRLAETWIHTGDIAGPLGIDPTLTPQLRPIARLAWRTLPYAFEQAGAAMTGPVALDLDGTDGERWAFGVDDDPVTIVAGDALELCLVAARRLDPSGTSLHGAGPDAERVLALIRTFA